MMLALSVVLVACGQSKETTIRTRWEQETHVFKITLADFNGKSNNFNTYGADGKPTTNGKYYKDIAFAGEFNNWDEIRPVDVSGTYTLTIKPSDDGSAYCVVTTSQVMYVKYKLKTDTDSGVDFDKYSELRSVEVTDVKEYTNAGLTKEEDTTILKSTTETYVKFENNNKQKPLESRIVVDGFYIGKENNSKDKLGQKAQALTSYKVETEYDYSGKKPVAKITKDGKLIEYNKFSRNSAGTFIDSNQILMYLRSLDKSSNSFQNTPSISVFNPYNQTLQLATFGSTYKVNVVLTDTSSDSVLATTLTTASVTIGNNAFMMQENLPDYLKLDDKQLDVHQAVDGKESMFTTVRFRVGYFAYEIDYSNPDNLINGEPTNWNAIWEALTPKPTKEEK